jgi:hypothetical protein
MSSEIEQLRESLDRTNARLRALEDERAVIDVLYQYGHGINGKQRELWLDVFTSDASWAAKASPADEWRVLVTGRDALGAWFDEHETEWPVGTEAHIISSPRVTLDGDRAEAISFYVTLLRRDEGGPALRSTGSYRDVVVRCDDGRWRILERRAVGSISHPSRSG